MNEQLKFETKNGLLWEEVNGYLATAFDSNGSLTSQNLINLLQNYTDYNGMSATQKKEWNSALKTTASNAWAYIHQGGFDINLSSI